MTLLLTDVTKFGIVFAADRQLLKDGQRKGKVKKVFPLKWLNAAIGYFGQAYVGSMRMDRWLERFTREHYETRSLEELAYALAASLEKGLEKPQKSQFLGFHLAGYVRQDEVTYPAFWFVRNIEHFDTTTFEYHGVLDHFQVSEEILGNHLKNFTPRQLNALLAQGGTIFFRNGTLAPYVGAADALHRFLTDLWDRPGWKAPQSLTRYKEYVRTRMNLAIQTCKQFSEATPPIEGPPDILAVSAPPGAEPKPGIERIMRLQLTSGSAVIRTPR